MHMDSTRLVLQAAQELAMPVRLGSGDPEFAAEIFGVLSRLGSFLRMGVHHFFRPTFVEKSQPVEHWKIQLLLHMRKIAGERVEIAAERNSRRP